MEQCALSHGLDVLFFVLVVKVIGFPIGLHYPPPKGVMVDGLLERVELVEGHHHLLAIHLQNVLEDVEVLEAILLEEVDALTTYYLSNDVLVGHYPQQHLQIILTVDEAVQEGPELPSVHILMNLMLI